MKAYRFAVLLFLIAGLAAQLGCVKPRTQLRSVHIPFERYAQPDNITCGPTSLRMVLGYYGKTVSHEEIMKHFTIFPHIGVLDPHICMAAMDLGFQAKTISFNYRVFHPSWTKLSREGLLAKLKEYFPKITNYKDSVSCAGYIRYLERGGTVEFAPMSRRLIVNYLYKGIPVIAALDMEYLYNGTVHWTEFRPEHATHFVVIFGYDASKDEFQVADPWYEITIPNENGVYSVPADRLMTAILLGFQVNDGDLVIVQKPGAQE